MEKLKLGSGRQKYKACIELVSLISGYNNIMHKEINEG